MDIHTSRRRFVRNLKWSSSDDGPHLKLADHTTHMDPLPAAPVDDPWNAEAMRTIGERPDLFQVITPINVERFAYFLRNHPNRPLVDSVISGLKEGFWPWADTSRTQSPYPDHSYQPLRRPSHENFVRQQKDEEIEQGRYSSSFGYDLLSGMQTIPVNVVPKPHSDKLRLVSNYSAGECSQNSLIPTSKVSVPLDDLYDLGRVLRAVRKRHGNAARLVVFRSDVSHAYRCLPMHPLWQIRQIVTIDGERYVDRCNAFGCKASGGIWGTFAGLVSWIAINELGLEDILTYVDDTFSWEFENKMVLYEPYNRYFPEKQARLLGLWDELGIPHNLRKQDFGEELTIIGMNVNPNRMTISIPPGARDELIADIQSFAYPGAEWSLQRFQRLHGQANWWLAAYPWLRPGLSEMERMIAMGQSTNLAPADFMEVTALMCRELGWFMEGLTNLPGTCINASTEWQHTEASFQLTAHATKDRIAFSCGKYARAYSHDVDATEGHSLRYLGALAVLSALHWVVKKVFPLPPRVAIFTDNQEVVALFNKLHARDVHDNAILTTVADLLAASKIDCRVFFAAETVRGRPGVKPSAKFPGGLAGFTRITAFEPPEFTLGSLGYDTSEAEW